MFVAAGVSLTQGCGERGPADVPDVGAASGEVNAEPDLFADESVADLTLEAAFTTAFRAAHAGEPNGPIPGLPRRVTDDFPGKLKFTTRGGEATSLDVILKVRGNSSLSECSFPKLSMKLTDEAKVAARSTMFAKQSKLKIGTHCDEANDDHGGTIGRLRNDKSPMGVTAEEMRKAKAVIAEKKSALYELLDTTVLDDAGRANVRAHLDAFFAVLAR